MKGDRFRVTAGSPSGTAEQANYVYAELERTRDLAFAIAEALACPVCHGRGVRVVFKAMPARSEDLWNWNPDPREIECQCRAALRAAIKEAGEP